MASSVSALILAVLASSNHNTISLDSLQPVINIEAQKDYAADLWVPVPDFEPGIGEGSNYKVLFNIFYATF